MIHHHFIGSGRVSSGLRARARCPEDLLADVGKLVSNVGFHVVSKTAAAFDNGGLTLVWILAESHLVLHHWDVEGFATLDLHLCNYRGSNIERARRLVDSLTDLCFTPGSETWEEVHLPDPVTGPRPISELGAI